MNHSPDKQHVKHRQGYTNTSHRLERKAGFESKERRKRTHVDDATQGHNEPVKRLLGAILEPDNTTSAILTPNFIRRDPFHSLLLVLHTIVNQQVFIWWSNLQSEIR